MIKFKGTDGRILTLSPVFSLSFTEGGSAPVPGRSNGRVNSGVGIIQSGSRLGACCARDGRTPVQGFKART